MKHIRVCVSLTKADISRLDDVATTFGLSRSQVISVLALRAHTEMNSDTPAERQLWEDSAAGHGIKARTADCDRLISEDPENTRLVRVRAILSHLWLSGGAEVEYDLSRNQREDLAWFDRKRAKLLAGDLEEVQSYLRKNSAVIGGGASC